MIGTAMQGGFRAAFFSWLLWGWSALVGTAMAQGAPQDAHRTLADDAVWQALLHLDHGRPTLDDAGFLLSMPRFSAQAELDATIAVLQGPTALQAVCRFPARYAWLRSRGAVADLPLTQCADLQEFLRRAPADHIALVFASENLAQPSSMMGHLFLKVAGQDEQGLAREHAISFFTDAATINLPKLLFDSLVLGKPGYFALSPYVDDAEQYVAREQRTLWEYELRLDAAQRTLLRYHLIELKQTSFTYFFHRHNCATLIKHIVAVAWPAMLAEPSWIDTPKDIVKLADQAGAIEATTVRAPSRWRIRAIEPELPRTLSRQIRDEVLAERTAFVQRSPRGSRQAYLSLELASAYNSYLQEQADRGKSEGAAYQATLEALAADSYADYAVEAMPRKDPVRAPADSQVRLGWKYQHGQRYLTLGVLPVSHTLADDNEQYFGETELRLFDLELKAGLETGRIGLERFTIYAAQSVLPRDAFTGGLSGQFKVGWEPQPGRELQDRTTFVMEGGLGLAHRPVRDVDVYALLNGGLGVHGGVRGYLKPSVGLIVREVYGMKSQVVLSRIERPPGLDEGVSEITFTQSRRLSTGLTMVLQAARRFGEGRQADTVNATLKRLF